MGEYSQAFPTMPPVKYQLQQLETKLFWIKEHALELEDLTREQNPLEDLATPDLNNLSKDEYIKNIIECAGEAQGHLAELRDILGYKKVPSVFKKDKLD